ncbi:hypothetical protein ACFL2U_00975 [Patescibacteria group bacterium]
MEALGSLQVGDVCWQLAQVVEVIPQEEGRENDQDKIVLHVSDEHGVMCKTTTMPRHMFKTQFFVDQEKPNFYFRKVKVDGLEDTTVYYIRIDDKDNPIGSTQRIKLDLFSNTYFLPQHQMGDL